MHGLHQTISSISYASYRSSEVRLSSLGHFLPRGHRVFCFSIIVLITFFLFSVLAKASDRIVGYRIQRMMEFKHKRYCLCCTGHIVVHDRGHNLLLCCISNSLYSSKTNSVFFLFLIDSWLTAHVRLIQQRQLLLVPHFQAETFRRSFFFLLVFFLFFSISDSTSTFKTLAGILG